MNTTFNVGLANGQSDTSPPVRGDRFAGDTGAGSDR